MFKGRVLLVLGAVNGIESLEMVTLIFYRAVRSRQLLRQRDKVSKAKNARFSHCRLYIIADIVANFFFAI